MKTKQVLIVFLLGVLLSPLVWSGDKEGNGGDTRAAEFIKYGRMFAHLFSDLQITPENLGFNPEQFKAIVEETRVIPKTQGDEDAVNHPDEKLIELNTTTWDQKKVSDKHLLVIHEYLGIMKVNDQSYGVSSASINLVNETINQKIKLMRQAIVQAVSGYKIPAGKVATYSIEFYGLPQNGLKTKLYYENWPVPFGSGYIFDKTNVANFVLNEKDANLHAIIAYYNQDSYEGVEPYGSSGHGVFLTLHIENDADKPRVLLQAYEAKQAEENGYVIINWDAPLQESDITRLLIPIKY